MEIKSEELMKNADLYKVYLKLSPSVYNYVMVAAAVRKKDADRAYRITRTMSYMNTFDGIRDRMFSGLIATYNFMYNTLAELDSLENGDLKNYFCVFIETDNDIKKEMLYYDIYFVQADNYEQVMDSDAFNAIPNIKDDSYHKAIMNFGYQYSEDMKKINIEKMILHTTSQKVPDEGLMRYSVPSDSDKISEDDFMNSLLLNTEIMKYDIRIVKDFKKNS